MTSKSPIVVCVDGSATSAAAVDWAAAEAARRHAPLSLVHVCEAGSYGLWTRPRTLRAALRQLTRPIVDEAAARARAAGPNLTVRSHLVLGSVVPSILRMSAHAQLIVVGRHGGRTTPFQLPGSVAQRVLAHAHCPAIMVVAAPGSASPAPIDRILAGVDGRFGHSAALDFAAQEAVGRGVELIVLHALDVPDWPVGPLAPAGVDHERELRRARLRKLLAELRAAYPEARVDGDVLIGHPGPNLVGFGGPGDLLVLGQHHHLPFVPARSGPVISTVVAHAHGCVAVVGEPQPIQQPAHERVPALAQGVIAY